MFTTRPEIRGTFGVVTSTHWVASAVGMAALERGGNAFDAGVACGFTLQVVEPHLNGPGGDLPAIFYSKREDRVRVLCAQGPAPAAATIKAYRDLDLDLIPGSGFLAAVVPGAFDGWLTLLRDYGTHSLRDVLTPAIGYARNGYPVVERITATVETVRELFETEWPTSAAVYLKGGAAPQPGTLFANPTMADTYQRILTEAEAGGGSREAVIDRARAIWAKGWVAATIDRFVHGEPMMDVSGRRHRGLLTAQDMADWQCHYEEPTTYDYGRYRVCKGGPWSQGPAMLQALAILDGMGVKDMDPTGPDFVHAVTEAIKLAFADREAFYGDPDFVDVPMQTLLSSEYNAERRKLIGERASLDLRPGTVAGYDRSIDAALGVDTTVDPRAMERMGVGEPTVSKSGVSSGDTVHMDIIDCHGNMFSATPSGGWLQSSPIVPELGFCLGNRAQMFWLDERSPSALAPKKRPRTTLSPGLALRDGEPYLAFGTPGGDQQDQWSLLLFLHHADHGMNLQEAIDCPAFHSEHFPSSFWPRGRQPGRVVLEGQFPTATTDALTKRGHNVQVGEDWSEGRLTAAAKDGEMLKAAANPRGMQGYAIGR
ncbi:gamma-glutamyltranspeptidase [alpha proteobacterium BAL199]|jgi:gamma-glutamyltranspeptidase / glutathione hydrolase|nr:gamma-glutamyltranspeptidase [alpha proteobacterium BAL199]